MSLFDPIIFPGRKQPLRTLRDAAQYITKLPKAEHDADEWQAAMQGVIAGRRTRRTADVRAHRHHEGVEPRLRSGVFLAQGHALGPTQAKARYVMTDPKKDACEPTDNKLGSAKQSREAERQRAVEEYVMDLREIVKKLRKFFS